MIIFTPPAPLSEAGAPNLSKGLEVFNLARLPSDEIVEVSYDATVIATVDALKNIHEPQYVDDILAGRTTNGYFGMYEAAIGANMHSLHSCAVLASAAVRALTTSPVFAPVSGFHHAGYDFCGGFCTFNGLVLAAEAVRRVLPEATILIIDGDGHHGDGTENLILRDRPWLTNLSLSHHSVQASHQYAMSEIKQALADDWDLVIYQAGADSHKDDRYCAGYLTTREWEVRDQYIFSTCKRKGMPIVFNLAGGYNGSMTNNLHHSTVQTCRSIYKD
jgi:acetoin utilization deacetylase AcuC-like enzyme